MGHYASDRYAAVHKFNAGRLVPTASGAAAEELARFRDFTATKILEARAHIRVAGKADTSGYTILNGTTSIGAIVVGTASATEVVDASLTDTDFDTDDDLVIQNIVATDTQSADITIHYQERFLLV